MTLLLAVYTFDTSGSLPPWERVFHSMTKPRNQFLVGLGIGFAGGLQASADYMLYYGRPGDLWSYLLDFRQKAFRDTACLCNNRILPNWPGTFLVGAGLAVPLESVVFWLPELRRREMQMGSTPAKSLAASFGAAVLGFGLGAAVGIIGGWLAQ